VLLYPKPSGNLQNDLEKPLIYRKSGEIKDYQGKLGGFVMITNVNRNFPSVIVGRLLDKGGLDLP